MVVFLSRELLLSMKLHLATEDSTVGAAQNMQSQDIITQAQQETQLLDEAVTVNLAGNQTSQLQEGNKNLKQE